MVCHDIFRKDIIHDISQHATLVSRIYPKIINIDNHYDIDTIIVFIYPHNIGLNIIVSSKVKFGYGLHNWQGHEVQTGYQI